MTVKFSHERKVRSFAKKTLGSTRVGSAIRLPVNCRISREFPCPHRSLGKRSTYQEPIEEEVGSTSCGGTDRSGLARMVWDGRKCTGSCSSRETQLAEVGSMK
jgi:hypothetical protein